MGLFLGGGLSLARVVNLIVGKFAPKSRQLLFGRPDGAREKAALKLALCSRSVVTRTTSSGVKEELSIELPWPRSDLPKLHRLFSTL